jgi:LemA protein
MNELTSTEDRIASARRYYNANVRELNTKVETVPSNFVAGMFNIGKEEYFEVEGIERDPVKVDFGQSTYNIPPPSSYAGHEAPSAPAAPQAAPGPDAATGPGTAPESTEGRA